MSRFNADFLEFMTVLEFVITLINYETNLEQSDNDDIMKELDQKTNTLIERLEKDLQEQNTLLQEILKKLEE